MSGKSEVNMAFSIGTLKSRVLPGLFKLRAGRLTNIMLAAAILLGSLSAPSFAKEYEGAIVDNLGQELGFPLYSWQPVTAPQAVILAIHGATLHGRSYTAIAKHLSQKGYAVYAPDLRGFGAWYHNTDDDIAKHVLYRQSESDLKNLLAKLHELYPGKPVFIMGESVGANFAVKLLAGDPKCADGMIMSSPAVKQRFFFGPTIMAQIFTVFFWKPSAQLDISPFIRSRVSESKEITEERLNDPLGRNKLNVGELFKTRWFNKECLTFLPQVPNRAAVLVLEGSQDKLFRADDINNLMAQMPCADKTLHLFKKTGHINLETQYLQPEVEAVVDEWLAEKTTKYSHQQNGKITEVSSLEAKNPVP